MTHSSPYACKLAREELVLPTESNSSDSEVEKEPEFQEADDDKEQSKLR